MKTYILSLFLFFGTSCEARRPQWGEKAFIVDSLRNWSSEVAARACTAENKHRVFLFQKLDEYFLVTHYQGVFDIAFIDTKKSPIEIEANGGLGRYVEIQKQFEMLRGLPGDKVGQQDYATYVSTAPIARCNF